MHNTSKSFLSFLYFINNNFFSILLVLLVFIGGFFSGYYWKEKNADQKKTTAAVAAPQAANPDTQSVSTLDQTPEVTKNDHIIGSSSAKITLIEYSDFSCGFCSRVYPTLKQIIEEYPKDVRLVYRHFLLNPTGPARVVADISECVAGYSSNEDFWSFIDAFFEQYSTDQTLIQKENLLSLTSSLGINRAKIESCVNNQEFKEKIEADIAGGRAAGVRGTPAIIIVTKDGKYDLISGAAPFESFKEKIELYL